MNVIKNDYSWVPLVLGIRTGFLRVKVIAYSGLNTSAIGGILNKPSVDDGAEALFEQQLDVITIGLDGFSADLSSQQVPVTHVDWRPPAEGDAELADLLSKLGS